MNNLKSAIVASGQLPKLRRNNLISACNEMSIKKNDIDKKNIILKSRQLGTGYFIQKMASGGAWNNAENWQKELYYEKWKN